MRKQLKLMFKYCMYDIASIGQLCQYVYFCIYIYQSCLSVIIVKQRCANSFYNQNYLKVNYIKQERQQLLKMQTQTKETQPYMIRDIKKQFTNFVQTWQENGAYKYKKIAELALRNNIHIILISTKDFLLYQSQMAEIVFNQYYKYEPILNQTITQFMHQYQKNLVADDNNRAPDDEKQRYQIAFSEGFNCESANSVRDLKSDFLGKLMSFRGTVTRTSQVRPELLVGVFKCMTCGTYSKEVPQQFKYTEPKKCLRNNCDSPLWELDLRRSQFADFQKIRIQQDPTKIPPGSMPRSIDIVLRNQNTEKGQPGDILFAVGYLCVSPDISSMLKPGQRTQLSTKNIQTRGNLAEMQGVTGLKGVRELNYKLIFIATHVVVENNQFSQVIENEQEEEEIIQMELQDREKKFTNQFFLSKIYSKLSENQILEIKKLKENPRLYDDLSQSLFPSIFGHSEIKKALLLQLFGGIHKKTQNKINIRGDINILIVGDPSTAKSQFLKCINKFVPRSVYTNGKTTSAAGLTASVTKDENGNVAIQAGALMLADNGICCIDQFDKMDIKDQVAIHEAMQQQTISIAKAGVHATLNARTSILAAANPLFGRYDKSKALKFNINISPPIMSRFDLFFIICDESDNMTDYNLGNFIVNLHRKKQDHLTNAKYDHKTIKNYIMIGKKIKPKITHEAAELMKKFYIELRNKDKSYNSYRITVRQLQSMIRLSEAYARLELNPEINSQHVKQAYRLLSCSILKLQKSPIELNTEEEQNDQLIRNRNERMNSNLMNNQIEKKKNQVKKKNVTLSHEIYQRIIESIALLFKERQRKFKHGEVQNDSINITQGDLVDYLLSCNIQAGIISNSQETQNLKKVYFAVIKKLIKEQRMLIVVQESLEPSNKLIGLHPNYQQ